MTPPDTPSRILLVDDNPDDRALLARELRREFPTTEVAEVASADDLAEAIEAGSFDAVLTDYRLGWGDGLKVFDAVKERWPDCPVVMFTGTGGEEIAVEAMKRGVDDYIVKSPEQFRQVPSAVVAARDRMRSRVAERERERAEEALRQSEERFRVMFEQAHVGMCILDSEGRFIATNRAFEEMLGYSAEELAGMPFAFVSHPEDIALTQAAWDSAGSEGVFRVEKRCLRKDGTITWTDIRSNRIPSADGAALTFSIAADVTGRKRLEEQLLQAQKMEAVGRLAGGIAHDFNNLLTAIIGYGGTVLARLPAESLFRADVEEIVKAGERAAALTQQLLAFGRRQILRPEVLDPNGVIAELEAMLRRLLGEDIELVTTLSPETGHVNADRGQLDQVIVNLAVNARDAMPNGGSLRIETANVDLDQPGAMAGEPAGVGAPVGTCVMIAVSDSGLGMDEETRSRVFEPFFTTKEQGRGTGLGLSTVLGIVEQSGGGVTLESELGRGSTFRVFLPKVEGAGQPAARPEPAALVERGGETILVVEDSDAVRQLVREVLERYGYAVVVARNGAEALELAGSGELAFDLLISDVVMPGISGTELAQRLSLVRPGLKVLFISGYPDLHAGGPRLPESGSGFIGKPFAPEELGAKVRQVLDG